MKTENTRSGGKEAVKVKASIKASSMKVSNVKKVFSSDEEGGT